MGTFRDRFGRPGKGNDKGKVEGLVKYTLMTPLPHAASFEALNAALIERCRARRSRGRPTFALALDLAACQRGFSVSFITAASLAVCEAKRSNDVNN